MKVLQTNDFARTVKKLSKQQKTVLDEAIQAIVGKPNVGDLKIGDLAGVRVYKFKMEQQLYLLAYECIEQELLLYLLKLGSHENLYRDLKR